MATTTILTRSGQDAVVLERSVRRSSVLFFTDMRRESEVFLRSDVGKIKMLPVDLVAPARYKRMNS